tara:strand:- start:1929 stop:2138 length:210 start_codon:yes stop_codon:yes gene_type:complete
LQQQIKKRKNGSENKDVIDLANLIKSTQSTDSDLGIIDEKDIKLKDPKTELTGMLLTSIVLGTSVFFLV